MPAGNNLCCMSACISPCSVSVWNLLNTQAIHCDTSMCWILFIEKGQSSEGSWGIPFHAWCTWSEVELCYLLLQRHQYVTVDGEVKFYYWFNVAFTIFFALEAILKIIAFTPPVSYYLVVTYQHPTNIVMCNVMSGVESCGDKQLNQFIVNAGTIAIPEHLWLLCAAT